MQFVRTFFHICKKNDFLISPGSVETYLTWGGLCMGCVENFICFQVVKNFENLLKFYKVTESLKVGTFLEAQYIYNKILLKKHKNEFNIYSICCAAQQYSPSLFLTSRSPSRKSSQSVSSDPGTVRSDKNNSVHRWTASFSRTAETHRIPLHTTPHYSSMSLDAANVHRQSTQSTVFMCLHFALCNYRYQQKYSVGFYL